MRFNVHLMMLVVATTFPQARGQLSGSPVTAHPQSGHPAGSPVIERAEGQALRDELPAVLERAERIRAELAVLDRAAPLLGNDWARDWAGTYYTGDGLGTNIHIAIAPSAGVAYQSSCCTGTLDANHGDIVQAIPGGVRVRLALDPDIRGAEFDSTLYFVRWGARKYLIPAFKIPGIVNAYNAGASWPRLMRRLPEQYVEQPNYTRGDRRPEPTGKPELPPEFAAMLAERPAEAAGNHK